LRYRGSENLKKHPHLWFWENIAPTVLFSTNSRFPIKEKYFKRISTLGKVFWKPIALDKLFPKKLFFGISQKPLEISKK